MDNAFVQWVNTSLRPWLRVAIFEKLDATIISDLERGVELCKQEANGLLNKIPEVLTQSATKNNNTVRIERIYGLKNVMGLCDDSSLSFDSQLTIIYGANGSGKSSYVKLLKIVNKPSPFILPNVFRSSDTKTSFYLDYSLDGHSNTATFPSSLKVPFVFDVYDEEDGMRYIEGDNDISVEPEELKLLKTLSDFSDGVKAQLIKEQNAISNSFQSLPDDYCNTEFGILYNSFSTKEISDDELALFCISKSELDELHNLELSLKEELQEQLQNKLKNDVSALELLDTNLSLLYEMFSASAKHDLLSLHDVVINTKRSSKEYAETVFTNATLGHIGESTWMAMWNAAEKYSNEVYPNFEFPYLGDSAVCVLCHQPLNNDLAKNRMISFREYVKSDLEQQYTNNLKQWHDLKCFTVRLSVDSISHCLSIIDDSDISSIKELIINEVIGFENWKAKAYPCPDLLDLDFCNEKLLQIQMAIIRDLIDRKQKEIETIEKNKEQSKVFEIKQRIIELKAKEWVSMQKENLIKHSEEIRKTKLIKHALALTPTNGITIKAKEISQHLLDDTYVANFNNAIKMLGAERIRVNLISSKAQKGRGKYRLVLSNARQESKLVDILSSGERRIVSLAAFIADSNTGRVNSPFVFGDPVSSLDNSYEISVATALCQLSQNRQVVVFSHRLSLIAALQSICKNNTYKLCMVFNEPGFGAGIIDETPALVCSNIRQSTNSICNCIKKENADCKADPTKLLLYRRNRESYCQKFRNLIEQSIEILLFAGIVKRFDRIVRSQKVKWASHITNSDCEFIDRYMTEYSAFDHSQSDDNPSNDITYEKLISDYEALAKFADDIIKRQHSLGY